MAIRNKINILIAESTLSSNDGPKMKRIFRMKGFSGPSAKSVLACDNEWSLEEDEHISALMILIT